MASYRRRLLLLCVLLHTWKAASQKSGLRRAARRVQSGQTSEVDNWSVLSTRHECTGAGDLGLSCLFYDLVLWQQQFYYITTESISIPEVREGWHMWWHPYGEAMLPEHVRVVQPSAVPWSSDSLTERLDEALIYNWLDQANMYHVMMETGNFIYATACKLLGACSHTSSHYQILSTGYFQYGEDRGMPAGHESLKCLSSKLPRWVGDPYFDNKVVIIGRTAVGIGVQCDDPKCTWDSVPFMQRNYTSGHRQLMLDCLEVTESQPSQQHTQVMIVQRQLAHGRSMLNVLEVQEALQAAGAQVKVFSTQGKSLKQQVEALASAHVYILIHGAAMALYMFLPRHAAIIEIQHYYARSPAFPSNLYQRTVDMYDLDYHHQILVIPRPQDMVLPQQNILEDEVYRDLDTEQKLLLWEQGFCPDAKDDLVRHCITKWVFLANLVIDTGLLMQHYHVAWQLLPPKLALTAEE